MEGNEAAPIVGNKKEEKEEKKEKKENIEIKENKENKENKKILILTLILYIFSDLIGLINAIGNIFKLILTYFNKFTFGLSFIVIYPLSYVMAHIVLISALGKKINDSSSKEKIFKFILSLILVFIFHHIKLSTSLDWTLSLIFNILIKSIGILKYIIFLPLCAFATNTIIDFIKK